MFIVVNWENTSEPTAKKMIQKIEDTGIELIGANMGEMLCFTNQESLDPIKETITDIVHEHNQGMWCEVKEVSEESIQHLL